MIKYLNLWYIIPVYFCVIIPFCIYDIFPLYFQAIILLYSHAIISVYSHATNPCIPTHHNIHPVMLFGLIQAV